MYDIPVRLLCSAFVDAESIVPNPTDINYLSKALNPFGLLPATTQELALGVIKNRLSFRTFDGKIEVILLGSRLNMIQKGEGRSFADFCELTSKVFQIILKHYHRRPHRLAAVQEGLLAATSADELDKIADRVLRLPQLYQENRPIEWTWRSVARIEREFGDKTEFTNSIATITRLQGSIREDVLGSEISERFLDRIRVDLDINTVSDNVTARFEEDDIKAFFAESVRWHHEFGGEIVNFIKGEQT